MRPYLAFLSRPDAALLMLASIVGRIPMSMMGLAILLLVREGFDSYSAAGTVTAIFAVSGGLAAILQGRLIDRLGQTPVLVVCGLGFPAALIIMVVANQAALLSVLMASAMVAGATFPPLAACLRALMPEVAGEDPALLRTGYSRCSVQRGVRRMQLRLCFRGAIHRS